jgi:hypothetical protein
MRSQAEVLALVPIASSGKQLNHNKSVRGMASGRCPLWISRILGGVGPSGNASLVVAIRDSGLMI